MVVYNAGDPRAGEGSPAHVDPPVCEGGLEGSGEDVLIEEASIVPSTVEGAAVETHFATEGDISTLPCGFLPMRTTPGVKVARAGSALAAEMADRHCQRVAQQSPDGSRKPAATSSWSGSLRGTLSALFSRAPASQGSPPAGASAPRHRAQLREQELLRPRPVRTAAERRVLTFSVQHGGARPADSPVVVKHLPVEVGAGGATLHVREVGICLAGSYRLLEGAAQGPNTWHVEWLRPGQVDEGAKPLEVLLEGATHVRLLLPGQGVPEMVEVSLASAHDFRADSLTHHVVPSVPRDCGSLRGGFRRFLLQVGWEGTLDMPAAVLNGEGAGSRGFAETGEVLAQALALRLRPGQGMSAEELEACFQQTPRLLYFASMGLLSAVLGPKAREAVRKHWERRLQLSVVGKFPMTMEQAEVRAVLRELLLARHHETGDRTCAVMPAGHLPETCEMLRRTKHPHMSLSIDQWNFEARARELETKQTDSTLTFVLVEVAGSLSPLQLASLLHLARGCLRLIFVASPGLQRSLALTRSEGRVLLAESLAASRGRPRPVEYRGAGATGAAVVAAASELLARPALLSEGCGRLPWARSLACLARDLARAERWREELAAWYAQGEVLLHLVAHDDELVAGHLRDAGAHLFDADENADRGMQPFSQLDALLEAAAQASGISEHDGRKEGPRWPLLVLFNHHLVLQSRIEDLVCRCHARGAQLVLVAPEPPSALRRVRVHLSGRCSAYVQAGVLHVRASLDDLCEHTTGGVGQAPGVRALLSSLRLVFGPEKLTCRQAQAVIGAVGHDPESPVWRDVVTGLVGSDAPAEQIEAAHDVLRGSLGLEVERASLAFLVGSRAAESTAGVSFSEFVRMPLCQLLAQAHRLEAWLRHLSPSQELERHAVAAFAPKSNCQSGELLELLASAGDECAAPALAPPTYAGTGLADLAASRQEEYMQYTSQGRDLDWAAIAEQWAAGKGLDAVDVAALLEVSPDAMKLALCIPPTSLMRLKDALVAGSGGLPPAFGRLRAHFLATAELLDLCACADASESAVDLEALLDRVAALKYLLLSLESNPKACAEQPGSVEDLSGAELSRLLRHRIRLSPSARGSAWVGKLLAMDEPRDLLIEQAEVRHALLHQGGEAAVVDLAVAPVGAAFVTLLTVPHLRQQLCRDESCPLKRVPLFAHLLAWLNGDGVSYEDGAEEVTACSAARVSAKAFSVLLVHSPSPAALQALVRGTIWAGCAHDPQKRAELVNALALEKGAEHLLVPLLEALVERENSAPGGQSGCAAFRERLEVPSCAALYDMLTQQDLAPYLAVTGAPPLPLDTSPRLLELYVAHFCSQPSDVEHLQHFQRLSESSCSAVAGRLLADRCAPRLLLWHCWARDPSLALPSTQFPQGEEDRPAFLGALASAGFIAHAAGLGCGLSAAARMIVKPHTLPIAVFNLLAPLLSWIHRAPPSSIGEQLLLVAQEGNSDYPPYCLRWHFRPLPRPLKEGLLASLRGSVRPMAAELELQDLYPRVTEGVSRETFAHNLGLLLALAQASPKRSSDSFIAFHKSMLAACILVWFKAQDVDERDLRSCIVDDSQDAFSAAWEQLRQTQTDEMRSKCTAGPLPTYIDVQWLEQEHAVRTQLFAVSRPSAQFTAQWLNNLCAHAGLEVPPFQAAELVEAFGPRDRDVRPGRRSEGALEAVAGAWGRAVAGRLFGEHLVLRAAGGALDTSGLTRHFSLLADFCRLLREQRRHLELLFRVLVEGLAQGLRLLAASSDADDGGAAVYDVLFLLLGVTPENGGLEMRLLTAEFHQQGLKASKQAVTEMEWLHRNFYNAQDETRANLGELVKVGVLLHPMRRHFHSAVPITRVSAASGRPASGLSWELPSYLEPEHFGLCLDAEGAHSAGAVPQDQAPAPDVAPGPTELPLPCKTVPASCFFTACPEAGRATAEATKHAQARRLQAGRATVAASGLLVAETSPTFYLYARIKVAPGMQPLLQQAAPDKPVFQLTSMETAQDRRRSALAAGSLCRVFASNADAWRHVDGLGPHTTLMADGFYLTKADDGRWVPVLATSRGACAASKAAVWQGADGTVVVDQRLCAWPLVHSHDLAGLDLDPSVLQLLELVVVLAFHSAEGRLADAQGLAGWTEQEAEAALAEALGKLSRVSVAVEAGRSGGEEAAWLAAYQQHERAICGCLRETLREVACDGAAGDLARAVAAVCRRTLEDPLPFMQVGDGGDAQVTELGVHLTQQLALVWCKIDPAPRRQLRAALGRPTSYGGLSEFSTPMSMVKKVVQHHRITLRSFERQGLDMLGRLAQAPEGAEVWRYDEGFTDSEEASDVGERDASLDDLVVVEMPPERASKERFVRLEQEMSYVDDEIDRSDSAGARVFARPLRFGRPMSSSYAVMSFYDSDTPHYFVGLDAERLNIQYSAEDGLPLGYLLHKSLIAGLLRSVLRSAGGTEAMLALRDRLLPWIANVLRSPISDDLKAWILRKVELQGRNAQTPPASKINSLVIAYSLCSCCPNSTAEAQFLRRVLMQSLTSAVEGITPTVESFIRRREQYGVYVVKGGTLFELQGLFGQENVAVCDFEREVSQRAASNSRMYLDIIRRFTGFTCIVYIQGLRVIEDALLKWLAEYTRHHTWRYVFFENVDTSWNFSENRDRCNFSFAPESPAAGIRSTWDLTSPRIAAVRPSHAVQYACCPPPELCRDPAELLAFFRQQLPCEFLEQLPRSRMVGDFRGDLRGLLERPDPCVVLVVSPPGAGKTFFMDDLRARLQGTGRATIVQFDGSSDILVTHTITELLDRAVAVQGERVILILDEYHMLADLQKAQLFEWIEEKAVGLQVVLIANRIDSRDRERVEACALEARLIETRLSRAVLDEKLAYSGVPKASWMRLRLWYTTCRLVFGEESISLRLVEPVAEALQLHNPQQRLRELLLAKVPTASPISVEHFVAAFLARTRGATFAGGPFAALFNLAALDEARDTACSFHEFTSRMPQGLLCAAPQVRLLCWGSYMLALGGPGVGAPVASDSGTAAESGKAALPPLSLPGLLECNYVDQVGTPFQLCEPSLGNTARGRAFSWAGDYESLDCIIDATKRGHSVDWHDLHDKHWRHTTITEGDKFCMLLSCCRNPGVCLESLTPGNIVLLLHSASPESAVMIARLVLLNDVHRQSSCALFPEALWALLLNDCTITSPQQIAEITDGVNAADLWSADMQLVADSEPKPPLVPRLLACLMWAQEHASDRRQIKSKLNATAREGLLQQALVLATLAGGGSLEQQGQLWSGAFAQLLVSPSEESEAGWALAPERGIVERALPVGSLRTWLGRCEAFEREWPAEVRSLWSVLHRKAPASVVNALWARHRVLLCETGARGRLSPCALLGVVHHEGGELDKELQRGILMSECSIPAKVTDDDLLRVAHAALRLIDPSELPGSSDPRLQRLVLQEASRRGAL